MKLAAILVVVLAVLLGGCTKTAVPVEIGKICSIENEKKYVVTNGFLTDRGSTFCSNIGGGPVRCGMDVGATAGGPRVFGADIQQGGSADEIEKLESSYKSSDIKIRDDAGNIIKLTDGVKLTGQMSITPDGSVCFMTVDKIEK